MQMLHSCTQECWILISVKRGLIQPTLVVIQVGWKMMCFATLYCYLANLT